MGIIFKKILFSCISILILAALGIPDVVKIAHTISEHKEQTCIEKGIDHFHEAEFDCEFHKYHITTYFLPQSINNTLVFQAFISTKNQNYYFLLSEFQQLHFSLRGPPTYS